MAASNPESLPDRFVGTHPDPVPDGGILMVSYLHVEKAGQTVAVTATDRDDRTEKREFEVRLRGNGKGSALFTVPAGWGGIVLSSADSSPHTVPVALPP